jgi:hypothetical protein
VHSSWRGSNPRCPPWAASVHTCTHYVIENKRLDPSTRPIWVPSPGGGTCAPGPFTRRGGHARLGRPRSRRHAVHQPARAWAQADVYAFGITLWEVVSRAKFEALEGRLNLLDVVDFYSSTWPRPARSSTRNRPSSSPARSPHLQVAEKSNA